MVRAEVINLATGEERHVAGGEEIAVKGNSFRYRGQFIGDGQTQEAFPKGES